MDDKEDKDVAKSAKSSIQMKEKEGIELEWSFCPVCANKIPKVDNLKYCIKCGTNLQYLKKYKKFQPKLNSNPYIQHRGVELPYPSQSQPSFFYGLKKIQDEEILETKQNNLWSTSTSIGLPLGAFLVMNILTAGIIFLIAFVSSNLDIIFDLISNPYFIIILSLFEFIFIVFPIIYVRKYLENPKLSNRFALLGFTTRGFKKPEIAKEILIGILFGIIGLFLVLFVSMLTEVILELIFNIEIVQEASGASSDVDLIISSADTLVLFLFSIEMILIVGTSEEILFRGFMQKGLTRKLGNKAGIIVTALIFSLIHLIGLLLIDLSSPIYILISFLLSFIPYFAISLVLGLIYQWRNENLIAVVITHGIYNTLTLISAFIFYGML